MRFRFYIISIPDGTILGTESVLAAENLALSEEFFVVDSSTGEWITAGGKDDIQEITS